MEHESNIIERLKQRRTRGTLLNDERGLSTVEYIILLVLIAAACISLWVTLGGELEKKLEAANTEMEDVKVDGDDSGESN